MFELEQIITETNINAINQTLSHKMINNGDYACIFHPNIPCNGEHENIKYVSKIQEFNKDEIKIGEIIKTIPDYDLYFAPIINSCNLEIAKVDKNEINKCKLFSNKIINFKNNTIRYVGNKNINQYLKKATSKFKMIHSHLLEALRILCSKNIIHLDLKKENIMYDDNFEIPIIIDFGLSMIYPFNMEDFSFSYLPEYEPWCIDIIMITYIEDETDNQISEEEIEELLIDYCEKNLLSNNFNFTNNQKEYWIGEHKTYFIKLLNESNTKQELIQKISENYKTWDNFSLCIIILQFLNNYKPNETKYMRTLSEIILSIPDKRLSIEECQKIFGKL